MKKATEKYINKLDELKIKYATIKNDSDNGDDILTIDWISPQKQSYRILVIIGEKDVAMRVFSIVEADETKRNQLLELCNSLNNKYRWIKFTIYNKGEMSAQIDAQYSESDAAEILPLLTMTMVRIVNDAFSEILPVIWS